MTSAPHTDAADAAAGAAAPVDPAGYNCWQLLRRTALEGGVLQVFSWEGERCLRIWLPPGYSVIDATRQPYPVLYLNDGQNLFGDVPTMSGASWCAAQAAAQLIGCGQLPPFLIVGIDHAGALRSYEYTPCTPGTGPEGFRSDASEWPGGGVSAYLDRLRDEVVPWVAANFAVSREPQGMAFGGSSFGGIAALVEGMRGGNGCGFGALLVESPSLWIGDPEPETFLKEVLANKGTWPQRVYLGMGGKEFSGTRAGADTKRDALFPAYLASLSNSLAASGLGPDRLACAVEPQHGHTESAWAARLPAALQFVGGGWWQAWEARYSADLFFTVPRRLKAGASGQLLFLNKHNSHTLADVPGGVTLTMGFNGWKDTQTLPMQPAGEVQRLRLQPPQQQQQQQQGLALSDSEQQHAGTQHSTLSNSSGNSSKADGCERQQAVRKQPVASTGLSAASGDWFVVQLPHLPASCYEVNFVFSDEAGATYDNAGGADFYLPVRQPEPLQEYTCPRPNAAPSRAERGQATVAAAAALAGEAYADVIAAATAQAGGPADEQAAAAAASCHLFFSMPPVPVAGAAATLYVNRARLQGGLGEAPNVKLSIGFNDWQMGHQTVDLKPTSLWRGEGLDWWSARVAVPGEAVLASLCFTAEWNGEQAWDNNWGDDYQLPVRSPAAAAAAAAAEAALLAADGVPASSLSLLDAADFNSSSSSHTNSARITPPGFTVREVESSQSIPHAEGTLEILELRKRSSGGSSGSSGGSSSRQRWWDEKRVRVWLPPGFNAEAAPPGGWPALLMCDGQNMFEDHLAHQGVSWHLGYAASGCISAGLIPPCVCIAIDSAGPYRSYSYLPFPPGTGEGGFRGDAARWPGGGAHDFLMRITHELLPMLQQRYGLAQDSSRLAFGGGSFAGVTALLAATSLPHVFGGVLVESPSLWVGEGRFLGDLASYSGRLPERLSLGCGTLEYSATRDHDRPDVDALLLHQYHEAARLLQERGLRGPSRLKFLVEEGAGHHEGAWRWRLSGALQFLAHGWWDS
ncbi:hypothetical protein OEZ85_009788 [Tetradesmus obliquus]|uniref:Carbohydrate binding module family 25 domain-containing protein n=1 Tax=Tetradesmus obliquus TaxID=3088 RepID=A0ABY8UCE6_TETOB|nr:hypothetical protein OEZ85_009788 [Tetradesmus obliquus]